MLSLDEKVQYASGSVFEQTDPIKLQMGVEDNKQLEWQPSLLQQP